MRLEEGRNAPECKEACSTHQRNERTRPANEVVCMRARERKKEPVSAVRLARSGVAQEQFSGRPGPEKRYECMSDGCLCVGVRERQNEKFKKHQNHHSKLHGIRVSESEQPTEQQRKNASHA